MFDVGIQFTQASLMYSFEQSNPSGKAIVVALFFGSIFAWSVMIAKGRELGRAKRSSRQFLAAYQKETHPVGLFLKRQRYPDSPLYAIYESACAALGAALEARGANPEELFMGGVGTSRQNLTSLQIRTIQGVVDRTIVDQGWRLERSMSLLATATTTAPFLGLLGTVWGVMDAFSCMVVSGSAMLSAVAPGISGALVTTVIGLLVALPSALGYNTLTDIIRRLCLDMEHYGQELMADIERQYQANV